MKIDSIVEVTAWFLKKGEQTNFEWLENLVCNKENSWQRISAWEKISEDIKPEKYKWINKNFNDTIILEDCIGFEFRVVSTGGHGEEHISDLEWEIKEGSELDTFIDSLEDLTKIAKKKYEELVNPPKSENIRIGKIDCVLQQKKIKNTKCIIFLTAWYYDSYQTFDGESTDYDSDYGLLGEVDTNSIKIVEEKNEDKKNEPVRKIANAS